MNKQTSNLIFFLLLLGGVLLLLQQSNTAPIKEPGFRALIVYESSVVLPKEQQSILTSTKLRKWLIEHCVKDEQGQPDYQIFDQHTDLQYESELWRVAMSRPRLSLPWLVVSNGRKGTEMALPATVDETLVVLEKYLP